MFGVEGNNIVVITLDVHCRFLSWSVKIRPFDPILKVFGNIVRIQYFFEKPFFNSFVVRNYTVGPGVLAKEQKVVSADYRHIEDGEYTAFGRQLDNDRSKIDFNNKIKADL